VNGESVVRARLVAYATLAPAGPAPQDSTATAHARTRVPLTIEAKQDVEVLVGFASKEVRGKLYVWQTYPGHASETPFVIRRGERFQMIKDEGEGQCRIRYRGKTHQLTSCPWLDGFTDHQQDIFQILLPHSHSARSRL
jgi:hypothetical protein